MRIRSKTVIAMVDLLWNAQLYATTGFAVFPVMPNSRLPLVKHGCHDATRDHDAISAWWAQWPDANIRDGLHGSISGVLAFDIDVKHGVDGFASVADLEAEFGALPTTVRARTPSGGAHLLFSHPTDAHPQNRVGIKRFSPNGTPRVYGGLDVRGDGGYIIAPPSRTTVGEYVWELDPDFTDLAPVPDWLLGLMLSVPASQRACAVEPAEQRSEYRPLCCRRCGRREPATRRDGAGRAQQPAVHRRRRAGRLCCR